MAKGGEQDRNVNKKDFLKSLKKNNKPLSNSDPFKNWVWWYFHLISAKESYLRAKEEDQLKNKKI